MDRLKVKFQFFQIPNSNKKPKLHVSVFFYAIPLNLTAKSAKIYAKFANFLHNLQTQSFANIAHF